MQLLIIHAVMALPRVSVAVARFIGFGGNCALHAVKMQWRAVFAAVMGKRRIVNH